MIEVDGIGEGDTFTFQGVRCKVLKIVKGKKENKRLIYSCEWSSCPICDNRSSCHWLCERAVERFKRKGLLVTTDEPREEG